MAITNILEKRYVKQIDWLNLNKSAQNPITYLNPG